jgi:hypothetical protein
MLIFQSIGVILVIGIIKGFGKRLICYWVYLVPKLQLGNAYYQTTIGCHPEIISTVGMMR